MMTFSKFATAWLVSLTCLKVSAAWYGRNHAPVRRDNEFVANNFQDVQAIELIAPAFTDPDSVPMSFSNGTNGPTNDATMGT